jgi:hypothetical protein
MQFEHKLTKYEVDNHCVLLRDEAKADHSKAFGGHSKLTVKAENGKLYPADINEYYHEGKFQAGIHFEGGKSSSFFVEQGFFLGHIASVTVDGSGALVDGRLPVDISFKILTR